VLLPLELLVAVPTWRNNTFGPASRHYIYRNAPVLKPMAVYELEMITATRAKTKDFLRFYKDQIVE
jgi:hypothetical protein